SGAARQLAAHCVPLGRDGALLRLALAPAHRLLKTRQQEDKIEQALTRLLGEPLRIAIEVTEPPALSAAQLAAQRQAERLAAVEEALQQEPAVRALQQTFGAVLRPQSIHVNGEESA
ncbi:MAG: DNA polymerase III subunit gamma/tau, partial [Steroidobacteraceae bacterium]|nr:DNA polymerase III subunit gamma/tau [Steroidobacteraceae bacterium]